MAPIALPPVARPLLFMIKKKSYFTENTSNINRPNILLKPQMVLLNNEPLILLLLITSNFKLNEVFCPIFTSIEKYQIKFGETACNLENEYTLEKNIFKKTIQSLDFAIT